MVQANQLYESGVYDLAAQNYQKLIDSGIDDGAVYYNLGNAYFKLGDLGRAIVNYRRAEHLLPRDPDVEANLQLARTQTRDRLEQDDNGFVGFIENLLIGWSTVDEVASVALGLWVLLCGFMVIALISRHQRTALSWIMVFLVVVLVFCMLSIGIRLIDSQRPHGVIVATSIEVRSGPGISYLTEFTLHAGAEIRVLENRSGWVRITLPGNLQGWVPNKVVEEL